MKRFLTVITTSLFFVFFATPAFAIDICPLNRTGQASDFNPLCLLEANDLGGIIGTIITLVFIIAVIIALAFLIWGGIRWILSGGDKAGVEAARNTIVAAIIGLVVVFLSYFILNFVIGVFVPGFSLRNITLPTIAP